MKLLRTMACGFVFTLLAGAAAQVESAGKPFLIVLIGPTGSGKTTHAEFLKKRFGVPLVSVDELIQANPAALAKYRRPGITPGPPELNPAIDALVADKLASLDLTKGLVLDGYPASKDQADHFAALIPKLNLPAPIVFQLDVPDDVIRQRLKERKRADDQPELIEERLKNYHREMDAIGAYFPDAKLFRIDTDRPTAEVSSAIEAIVVDELKKQ